MAPLFTSASRLLSELKRIEPFYKKGNANAGAAAVLAFSFDGRISWLNGLRQYEKLVAEVRVDLDILPEDRRSRYSTSIDQNLSALLNPASFGTSAQAGFQTWITELVTERLENLHDALVMAGRTCSMDEVRTRAARVSIDDLIAELESGETNAAIEAVLEQLRILKFTLEQYELYGPEGAKDAVAKLIGVTLNEIYVSAIVAPDQARQLIGRVLGVSKVVLDGFVYIATAGQAIEWSEKVLKLLT